MIEFTVQIINAKTLAPTNVNKSLFFVSILKFDWAKRNGKKRKLNFISMLKSASLAFVEKKPANR
jgi:hypothetical protein